MGTPRWRSTATGAFHDRRQTDPPSDVSQPSVARSQIERPVKYPASSRFAAKQRSTLTHVAELRCVDGSRLEVIMVPARDRGGTPYEVTLELRRDGRSFGAVGERCGYFLATLARRVTAARADGSPEAGSWPDE